MPTSMPQWDERVSTLEALTCEVAQYSPDEVRGLLDALAVVSLACAESLECFGPATELGCFRNGIQAAKLALRARAVRTAALGLLDDTPPEQAAKLPIDALWAPIVTGMRTMLAELRARRAHP